MKARDKTPTIAAAAEKRLDEFISKFDQKNQALIRATREGAAPATAGRERTRLRQLQFFRYWLLFYGETV